MPSPFRRHLTYAAITATLLLLLLTLPTWSGRGARYASVALVLERAEALRQTKLKAVLDEIEYNADSYYSSENVLYRDRARRAMQLTVDLHAQLAQSASTGARLNRKTVDSICGAINLYTDSLRAFTDEEIAVDSSDRGFWSATALVPSTPAETRLWLAANHARVGWNCQVAMWYFRKKISGEHTIRCYFGRPPVLVPNTIAPRAGELYTADIFLTAYDSQDEYRHEFRVDGELLNEQEGAADLSIPCPRAGLQAIETELVTTHRRTRARQAYRRTFYVHVPEKPVTKQ